MRPIFVAFKSAQDSLYIYVFVMPVACMEVKFRHRPSNFTAFYRYVTSQTLYRVFATNRELSSLSPVSGP